MKILGIETSCDETAAAVVEDGRRLLSNVVASQVDLHRQFGGVVPEVAARSHIEVILPVINAALDQAKVTWGDIDVIAVTYGPGLPGALLVGVTTARTLALVKQKPLLAVDHVAAHTYSNFINKVSNKKEVVSFPVLALIVSGGHTQLVLFKSHHQYEILGQTLDDAVGEAFDKVAKMLGLGFPGGPAVAKTATKGDPNAYGFTQPNLANSYDFSFSGLKTGVLRQLQREVGKDYGFASTKIAKLLSQGQVRDMAASFQATAINWLVQKTLKAWAQYRPKQVVIAGGVAANELLRQQLTKRLPIKIIFPPVNLCTDNAAMIASAAYWQAKAKQFTNPLELETNPSLSM